MLNRLTSIIAFVLLALAVSPAWADEYSNTIAIFQNAGESGKFFQTAYGYAVFPTIVKGAFIVGGIATPCRALRQSSVQDDDL
jgi:hypothetical protein